jgi:D-arginine dehydrogenase
LQARQLVNAAGAWADRVAEQCGWRASACNRADVARSPSQARQHDFARWPAVIGVDESFYFKPDAGQLLGSPANADPVEPQDAAPEELDLALGIYNIEAMTTLDPPPSHTWAGCARSLPTATW